MILIVNTSSKKSLIVKVSKNNFQKKIFGANFNHSEKLLPEISKFFGNNNLKKLKGIVVISGPGSYTGLRVGVATANALSYSLNIPIVGINRLEWLACQLRDGEKGRICSILLAIHDQNFAGFYNFNKKNELKQKGSFFAGDIRELFKKIKNRTIFIVENREELRENINEKILEKKLGKNFVRINYVNLFSDKSIKVLVDLSFNKLKNVSGKEVITPLYIRKPNIT